jgi:signal transduction histidine kinase
MSARKAAIFAFASAISLLLLCGVAALTVVWQYSSSAQWVAHSYEVQFAAGEVESALSDAARNGFSFLTTGDESYLPQYGETNKAVSDILRRVSQLTREDVSQQQRVQRLDALANERLALLEKLVSARNGRHQDESLQKAVSQQNTDLAEQVAGVVSEIQAHEDVLLKSRKDESSKLYRATLWVLGGMLTSAVFLFWIHYRLLNGELGKRERAESGARRLSARVMELQDEERRKFSRELHDSLGQTLAVAKMIAHGLSAKHPDEEAVVDLVALLDRSIQETRTISHLLHPPLLDELGIGAAIKWYVDGFSQRSGLQVNLEIADSIGRFAHPVELALFRVLQESLTNVHYHAQSPKADVTFYVAEGNAVLHVRDYGVGIPAEKLKHFEADGTQVGVGLTGMRERVREQNGHFEIYSDQTGTEVLVTIPLEAPSSPAEEDTAKKDLHAETGRHARVASPGEAH